MIADTFYGVPSPKVILDFVRGAPTDNEAANPGLGVTIPYSHPHIQATVYIYSLGATSIPEGPLSEPVRQHFRQVMDEVELMAGLGGRGSARAVKKYATGSPDRGQEFLCAEFAVQQGERTFESYAYLTGHNNHFVKLRLTAPSEARASSTARAFADAFAAVFWPHGQVAHVIPTRPTPDTVHPTDSLGRNMYYVRESNQTFGPATIDQIREWFDEGRLLFTSLVCTAGESQWKPLSTSWLLPANYFTFMVQNGAERMGPLSADQVRELFTEGKIDFKTPVCLSGGTDWRILSATGILPLSVFTDLMASLRAKVQAEARAAGLPDLFALNATAEGTGGGRAVSPPSSPPTPEHSLSSTAAGRITLLDPLLRGTVVTSEQANRLLLSGDLLPHAPALWEGSASPLPVGFAPGVSIRPARKAAVRHGDTFSSSVPSPHGPCALLTKEAFLGFWSRPRTSVFPQSSGGPLSGLQIHWSTKDPSLLLKLHEATADYVSCVGVPSMQAAINRLGFSFWQIHQDLNRYVAGAM